MFDDLDDFGESPALDLAVDPLDQVDSSGDNFPAPALVADAVVPELLSGKGRDGVYSITYETAGSVRIQCQKEDDEEMMGVPESLKGLLAHLCVCSREH